MGRRSNAREQILSAASDLLWENGCCCATVENVCERAGILKGSFYYFFESKTALMTAAVAHIWKTILRPSYETHFSPETKPDGRIRSFLKWVEELQTEKCIRVGRVVGWPVFLMGCIQSGSEQPLRDYLCSIDLAERRYFESALRDTNQSGAYETFDPVDQAMVIKATMEWTLSRARLLNRLEELKGLPTIGDMVNRRFSQTEHGVFQIPEAIFMK